MERTDLIKDANVTIRLKTYCECNGIKTIGELIDKPEEFYYKAGSRTVNEIRDLMYDFR